MTPLVKALSDALLKCSEAFNLPEISAAVTSGPQFEAAQAAEQALLQLYRVHDPLEPEDAGFTTGPWVASEGLVLTADGMSRIADCEALPGLLPAVANARRIAACANALGDIPTRVLEQAGCTSDVIEALQQRQPKPADATVVPTGPWLVEQGTGTISAPPLGRRLHREPVAYVPFYIRDAEHNARRIVASVNLLSEIPVDSLEQLKGPDDLIEALQQEQGMTP